MRNFIVMFAFVISLSACQESLEERAAHELRDYTEKFCPTPVVNYQRTDSATFEPSTRTVHYYMSICGKADSASIIKANEKALREGLLNDLRSDTKKKAYKDAGFNFHYTFHSGKNPSSVLLDARFTPREYR